MVQLLVKLSPKETNSITTASDMDFPRGEAWTIWSEMESWRESHGRGFTRHPGFGLCAGSGCSGRSLQGNTDTKGNRLRVSHPNILPQSSPPPATYKTFSIFSLLSQYQRDSNKGERNCLQCFFLKKWHNKAMVFSATLVSKRLLDFFFFIL